MQVHDAIAEILKREGVEILFGYPINPIFDAAARADIRPLVVRQERIGVHMADALSRMTSGRRIGVFTMQSGPGSENAFGAVAQAYSESVPLVVLAQGYQRAQTNVFPYFSSLINYRNITKLCEQVTVAAALPDAMRRAFTQARNGRPGPALIEIPSDVFPEEVPDPLNYEPTFTVRSAPDPRDVDEAARVLVEAERPLLYAGQGVHYARAWDELRQLAELLESPVTTSLEGKSAFPEDHPLSLGSGGRSLPGPVYQHLLDSDVIFGIGASFTRTNYGISFPPARTYIHSTNDPRDLNKDIRARHALIGDAQLTLSALAEAVSERLGGKPRGLAEAVSTRISSQREEWMQRWLPKLTSSDTPLSPYRVIWDLLHTVDVGNTVITHDAGSPRDQISPFWTTTAPLSYIGWGKTTQLGYGLGLAMGAKIAEPEKLCINLWGDAAIGMTGMDFETAARERVPILSILLNNFSMAIELAAMKVSTEKYRSTDISGNYADFARSLGGYGERITDPTEIIPAIKRAIEETRNGRPALLEFITQKETETSSFPPPK
jgi:thiamine pyrophosphate-dependent acetolactate synthase large subunit-like protein